MIKVGKKPRLGHVGYTPSIITEVSRISDRGRGRFVGNYAARRTAPDNRPSQLPPSNDVGHEESQGQRYEGSDFRGTVGDS